MIAITALWLSSTAANAIDQVDGVYQITNATDLVEFAAIVNGGENGANAVLTADIDMTDVAWTPIGNSDNRFVGTFDGQFHTVNNLRYESYDERIGIFGVVNGGCVIKNFIAGPGNEIRGGDKVGGIIGCSDGSGWVTLENVGHEGYVYGTGNNVCAFIGVVMNGGPATRITNCYNMGNVSGGGESAIIAGWFGGHGSVEVRGFWNTGVLESGQDGSNSLWRNSTGITAERIFHLYADQGASVIEEGAVESGKLAYGLNDNQDAGFWRQNLSEPRDLHPTFLPDHLLVYANGALDCAGNPKEGAEVTYSNTEGATRDDHHFTDGICTVCGTPDTEYILPEEGVYTLASATDVKWFAAMVNKVDASLNAKLSQDINFEGVEFSGIATASAPYCGTFDGQGHVVSNLFIDLPGEANVGFFREITAGAHIMNFTIDASSVVNGKNFAAAFIGHVSGNGEALLEQLGNEATVTTTDQNAGGIVGCNTSGELHLTLLNCYNAGNISSGWEAGGLSGWLGNDAVTNNCYNMGVVTNGESFARGNNIQITNCFDPVTDWPALPVTPIEWFTDDTVYNLLAEAAPGVWFLSQEVGGHPVLYNTGIVSGIRHIAGNQTAAPAYDLQGRRVAASFKGVVISNGKKMVRK